MKIKIVGFLLLNISLLASPLTQFLSDNNANIYINNGSDINETRSDWTDSNLTDNIDNIISISLTDSVGMSDSDLSGIEDLSNLESLIIKNNEIETIDLSSISKLTDVDLSANKITSLTLPSSIISLNVSSNQLNTINLFGLNNLKTLNLYHNPMNNDLTFLNDVPGLENLNIKGYSSDTYFSNLSPLSNLNNVKSFSGNIARDLIFHDSNGDLVDRRADVNSSFCHFVHDNFRDPSNYGKTAFSHLCKTNLIIARLSYNPSYFNTWIDFNDNNVVDSGELNPILNYNYYTFYENKDKIKKLEGKYSSRPDSIFNNGGSHLPFSKSGMPYALGYESSYNGIEELSNLEDLTIYARDKAGIFSVSDTYPQPSLSNLTKLKKLKYIGTPLLTFIDPVASQLELLSLHFGERTTNFLDNNSLISLKKATNLKAFQIHSDSKLMIESIGDLSFAPNLKYFMVGGKPKISNLDIVNGSNIEFLKVGSFDITSDVNISSLGSLVNLKVLDLASVKHPLSLKPLENLSLNNTIDYSDYKDDNLFGPNTKWFNNTALSGISSEYLFKVGSDVVFAGKGYLSVEKPLFNSNFCTVVNNDLKWCQGDNNFLTKLAELEKRYSLYDIWIDFNNNNIKDTNEISSSYTYSQLHDNKDKIKEILLKNKLTSLTFNSSNLSGLEELINLKDLKIKMSSNPNTSFNSLLNLETLIIYPTVKLTDLSNLSSLSNLKTLVITENRYNSHYNFEIYSKNYTNNNTNDSFQHRVSDFSFLNNMTKLEKLGLFGFVYLPSKIDTINFSSFPSMVSLRLNSGSYKSSLKYNIPANSILDKIKDMSNLKYLQLKGLYLSGDLNLSLIPDNVELFDMKINDLSGFTDYKINKFKGFYISYAPSLKNIKVLSDLTLGNDLGSLPYNYGPLTIDNKTYVNKAYYNSPFCKSLSNNSKYCASSNRFLDTISNSNVFIGVDSDDDNVLSLSEIRNDYTLQFLTDNKDKILSIGGEFNDFIISKYTHPFNLYNINDFNGINELTNLKILNVNLIHTSSSVTNEVLDFSLFPNSLRDISISTFLTNLKLINGENLSNLSFLKIFKPNPLSDSSYIDFTSFTNSSVSKISTIGKIEDNKDCGTNLSLGDKHVVNFNLDNFPNLKFLNYKYLTELSGNKLNIITLKTMLTSNSDTIALGDFSNLEMLTAFVFSNFDTTLNESLANLTKLKVFNLGAAMLGSVEDFTGIKNNTEISDTNIVLGYNTTFTGGVCVSDVVLNAIPEDKKFSSFTPFCNSDYINQNPLYCKIDQDSSFAKNNPLLVNAAKINATLKRKNPSIPESQMFMFWADLNNDGLETSDEDIYPVSNNDLFFINNHKDSIVKIDMPPNLSLDADLFSLLGNQEDINDLGNYSNLKKINLVTNTKGNYLDFTYLSQLNNLGELNVIYLGDINNTINISSLKINKFSMRNGLLPVNGHLPEVKNPLIVDSMPTLISFDFRNGNSNYSLNPNLSSNSNLHTVNLSYGTQEYDIFKNIGGMSSLKDVHLEFNGVDKNINIGDINTNKDIVKLEIIEHNPKCKIPNNLTSVASCDGVLYTNPVITTKGLDSLNEIEVIYLKGIYDYRGLSGITTIGLNNHLEFHDFLNSASDGLKGRDDYTSSSKIQKIPSSTPFCQSSAMISYKNNVSLSGYNSVCGKGFNFTLSSTSTMPIKEKEDGNYRTKLDSGSSNIFCIDSGIDLEAFYNVGGSTDLKADLLPFFEVDNSDNQENIVINDIYFQNSKKSICLDITKSSPKAENIIIKFEPNIMPPAGNILEFDSTAVITQVYTDLGVINNIPENPKIANKNVPFKVALYENPDGSNPIDLYPLSKIANKIKYSVSGDSPECVEPVLGADGNISVFGFNSLAFKVTCDGKNTILIELENENPSDNISGNKYTSSFYVSTPQSKPVLMGPDILNNTVNGTVTDQYYISDSNIEINASKVSILADSKITYSFTVNNINKNIIDLSLNSTLKTSKLVLLKIEDNNKPGVFYTKFITLKPYLGEIVKPVTIKEDSSFLLIETSDTNILNDIKAFREHSIKVYDVDNLKDVVSTIKEKFKDTGVKSVITLFRKIKNNDKLNTIKAVAQQKILSSNNFDKLIEENVDSEKYKKIKKRNEMEMENFRNLNK